MSERVFCASKLITRVLQISSDEFSPSHVLVLKVSFRWMRGLWFFEHSGGKVTNPQEGFSIGFAKTSLTATVETTLLNCD